MAEATRLILLGEDDPDHELLTIRALKKSNIANEVRVARDGEEAIAKYQATEAAGAGFDAVVLDLTVPGGIGGMAAAA